MGSRSLTRAAIGAAAASLALVPIGAQAGSEASHDVAARPPSARPLVGTGLERALARHGTARAMIALRPQSGGRQLSSLRATVAAAQARVLARVGRQLRAVHRWRAVPALAGTLTRAGLVRLRASPDVLSVGLVRPIHADLAESVPLIHADAVHARGVTGKGVRVAIIDTGVDTDNPDLADDIRDQACFITRSDGTGGCQGGATSQIGPGAAEDERGHGTQVSSIITGNGSGTTPKGVAPGAEIVVAKVFDVNGKGSSENIVSALDWVINFHPEVRVINMSLGGDSRSAEACDGQSYATADASALNALYARGVIAFAASGNDASSNGIEEPACISNVVSVGAVYDAAVGSQTYSQAGCTDQTSAANQVTCFSNAGPALDLLAPGARITTAARNGGTVTGAGTSFATPHAAAVVALLLERRPDLSPAQIATILRESGVSVVDPRNGATYKRIDAQSALDALGGVSQGSPAPAGLPSSAVTFGDGTGDDEGGPDLAQTDVLSGAGILRFTVRTPNRGALTGNESVQVHLDVDRNPATGTPGFGADMAVYAFASGIYLGRWVNGRWETIRQLHDASYSGNAFAFGVSQQELGVAGDFNFRVIAVDAGQQVRDVAPDTDSWFFPAYAVSVTTAGSGTGAVTVDGSACSSQCRSLHRRGVTVALHAAPAAGSVLAAWDGPCSGDGDCALTMDSDKAVIARFELLRRLAVVRSGRGTGSVTSSPGGISCGETCAADFVNATKVVLNARATVGSRFHGWTGACGGGACEVSMNEARSVSAAFDDIAAPVAQPLAARAKRGARARLRFRLADNSKEAMAVVTVLRGKKKLATLRRSMAPVDGSLYAVQWKVPKRLPTTRLTFCVLAADASGNHGARSCALLRVK